MLGPTGCTRVYGPQKGLREEDFEFAERCLEQLAHILAKELHISGAEAAGAGAAGGLGFGLHCFAGARLEPGFALFARYARLAQRLQDTQLVLTGEGAIDDSTLMGKGVGELAGLCRRAGVPCVAFGGVVYDPRKAMDFFTRTYALTPDLTNANEAMTRSAVWLEKLAAKAAREWKGAANEVRAS